jgi:Spy/CpxP family protein refolding chaperone
MNKHWKWIALAATVALIAAVALPAAFAQQPDQDPNGGPPDKAEMQKRMKAMRRKLLTTKVGLSEEKANKVEKVIDSVDEERQKIHKSILEEKKTLKELLEQNSDDQDSYEGALARLRAAHKQQQELRDKQIDALKKELTPKEQAKMLKAMSKFKKKMARKVHKRGRPGRRAPQANDAGDGPEIE